MHEVGVVVLIEGSPTHSLSMWDGRVAIDCSARVSSCSSEGVCNSFINTLTMDYPICPHTPCGLLSIFPYSLLIIYYIPVSPMDCPRCPCPVNYCVQHITSSVECPVYPYSLWIVQCVPHTPRGMPITLPTSPDCRNHHYYKPCDCKMCQKLRSLIFRYLGTEQLKDMQFWSSNSFFFSCCLEM